MPTVTESEAMQTLPLLLRRAQIRPTIVTDGNEELAVIVSMEDFDIVRRAKADRAVHALDILGEELADDAKRTGMSLSELEKLLDRKAP